MHFQIANQSVTIANGTTSIVISYDNGCKPFKKVFLFDLLTDTTYVDKLKDTDYASYAWLSRLKAAIVSKYIGIQSELNFTQGRPAKFDREFPLVKSK